MQQEDFNIERAFISCLLGRREIEVVREERITPAFFTGDHKTVFSDIYERHVSSGELMSLATFRALFPRYKLYRLENGNVGTEENIPFWIDALRKKVKHNKLADAVENAGALLNENNSEKAKELLIRAINKIDIEIEKSEDTNLNANLDMRRREYEKKKINQGIMGIPTDIPFLDYLLKGFQRETLTTLIAPTGQGKAMPLDTPILTPQGFIPLRDVHAGTVIYDESGNETTVIKEFYQGFKRVYRITFNDGASVDCCEDHLWKFNTRDNLKRGKTNWKVKSLKQILNGYKVISNDGSRNIRMPVNACVNFKDSELPLPAYLMGCLLGDGGFSQPQITFTNVEEDIIKRVCELVKPYGEFVQHKNSIQWYFKGGTETNFFREYIRGTFQWCKSEEKFVPHEYLISSVENRISLIQGLIDTDGSINCKGQISFSSKSRRLVEDLQFLIRSVGSKTSMHVNERPNKGVEYTLTILDLTDRFFSSVKHKAKYASRIVSRKKHHYGFHRVVSIEKLDVFREMKCIMVDSPLHTFICKDFIVTHNTYAQILIGANALLQGYKVIHGLTEMSSAQIRDRYEMILFAKMYGAINANQFKAGKLPPDVEGQYFKFLEEYMSKIDLPIFTAISPMQVSAEVEKHKPDLLLIDGVYLMEDDEKSDSDWLRVAHITRTLKKLVKNKHIAAFVNSQADKNTSKKVGAELGDISYSQAIGQDSDNILALFRSEQMRSDREMCLKVLKNREGDLGKIMLSWDFNTMQFAEIYHEETSNSGNDDDEDSYVDV